MLFYLANVPFFATFARKLSINTLIMEQEPILNAHNKLEYEPAHTAEHILNQTMVRMYGCPRSRNSHVERKKSKLNYELAECPSDDEVKAIEEQVNAIIAADVAVTTEFVTRDQVPAEVSLEKLPDDASATLRLVRIGDYDVCACIGSHVEHTAECGHFRISSTSWTPYVSATPCPYPTEAPKGGTFRIVFRLDGAAVRY